METKANYILLGAATIAGLLLIMLFALWLTGGEYRRGYQEYDIVFDDPVRGLTEGGEVRFNGIKVGEVRTLRIDPDNTDRVIARVRITSDVPVRRDSTAQLEPIGLTGVTLIQLSPGAPSAPLLRADPFGPVPRIVGRGSQIDILVERSEDIVLRASEAMAAVRDLLTDENIARMCRCNIRALATSCAFDWVERSGRLSRHALASYFCRSISGTESVDMIQPIVLANFSLWRGEMCHGNSTYGGMSCVLSKYALSIACHPAPERTPNRRAWVKEL